jgi:NAD(P)-dependent dehydrogenase (short-subunit alcohol dehydrogenase family)
MALLRVLTSQKVVRGTGRRRTRVRKVVVLYQVALNGMADGHGRCTGRVRLTYKPSTPAQAGLLLMTARALASAASANVRVTIVNAGTIATRHLERGEHDARGYRGHAARHRT